MRIHKGEVDIAPASADNRFVVAAHCRGLPLVRLDPTWAGCPQG